MKRHALFVGVNDYADEAFKNLRYSLSDAVALSGAFAARGFDVEVLSNPKTEAVLGAVERKAAGLGPGDVFLFFFAGHGFTAPDGSHLLICSSDRLAYLRHNRAGIPVDLLEDITNGRGCNRAFLLDACRTDVFAGVENRGVETRDLAFVTLPDAKVHAGTCCVLRSCDRFCPAMEFDDLGHGVFTRAVMDMLCDESARATPFGETFVAGIRSRMRGILSAHNIQTDQNPCFQTNGEAFFLFDGVAPMPSAPQPSPSYHQSGAVPTLVVCPICGKKNHPENTFKCRECGRDNLCLRHQDDATFLCVGCASKRKAREVREDSLRNGTCLATGICRMIVLPGRVKMEMIYCPPGEFMMGSPAIEEGRSDNETQHRVRLTKGFWLGKYPVTQDQWRSVMHDNPSAVNGNSHPVENVTWENCQEFIKKVNVLLNCCARLPTEAEWEYACRAGTDTPYSFGGVLNGDMANCDGGYPYGTQEKGCAIGGTTPVGRYAENPWGFCDMHGNVWEWCADRYGDYPTRPMTDPIVIDSGIDRVRRGGGWDSYANYCRSAFRTISDPSCGFNNVGFRLACSAGPRMGGAER